jgi:hypothetical protein
MSPAKEDRLHLERSKLNLKYDRGYSMERNRLRQDLDMPVSVQQMTEANIKRQDNFNHFISDLDKRI